MRLREQTVCAAETVTHEKGEQSEKNALPAASSDILDVTRQSVCNAIGQAGKLS